MVLTAYAKPPATNELVAGGFVSNLFHHYLFAVLSRKGRFVAVVETTVMSPRALMVYTLPADNETAVRAMAFVVTPANRVLRSYTPFGTDRNAPADL